MTFGLKNISPKAKFLISFPLLSINFIGELIKGCPNLKAAVENYVNIVG